MLQQDPYNIPALYAMIAVMSNNGDVKGCLAHFQTIFKIDPNIQPDIRVPIGICFHNLGMMKEARSAFERAIARVLFGIISSFRMRQMLMRWLCCQLWT